MKKRLQKKVKKDAKVHKGSLQKLSNKNLNRLAKKGKLKPRYASDRRKVIQFLNEKLHPETQKHLQPEGANRREVQDIPLQEADYEYFAKPGRDLGFLTEKSFTESSSKRKRKKPEDEKEEDYEKQPRKRSIKEKQVKMLLPIKSKEKGVISREEEQDEEEELEEETELDMDDTPSAEPTRQPMPKLTTVQILLQRKMKLGERKQRLAQLASSILAYPEEGMVKLKELRSYLEETDPDVCVTVRKLTMVSLLEVFKDIIPAYKIRVTTEKEQTQAAKKETKQLRDFEDSLVTNYRLYLEFLEKATKGNNSGKNSFKQNQKNEKVNGIHLPPDAVSSMREVAVRCFCELLVTHPHFNYRTNIITVLMPYVTHKNQKLSDMVCGHIKKLFREDKSGEVTLEVVRLIGRIIKAKNFDVKPKVLHLFLALKIKEIYKPGEMENKADRKAKMKKMSKREKKRHKQMKDLEKELNDASAEDVKKRKLRLHTEIINMIFLTYFRILKTARQSILLSAVLEGLAKFAHMINVDFFDDLFAVLNDLVDSEELTYRESLHCVQTAFTILSGQGSALNIDPMRFYTHMYKTLFQLHAGISSEDMPIALTCMDVMINKRRKQVSQQRLLAYLKRVTTLCLQLETHGAVGGLATARTFIQTFPKSDLLLDTDCQGSGFFMAELDEPEHCNAHNTALYELHMLRHHYHPMVRQYSGHVLAGAPSQGKGALPAQTARKTPMELYTEYDPSGMIFNPTIKPKVKGKQKRKSPNTMIQPDLRQMVLEAESAVDTKNLSTVDFQLTSDAPNVMTNGTEQLSTDKILTSAGTNQLVDADKLCVTDNKLQTTVGKLQNTDKKQRSRGKKQSRAGRKQHTTANKLQSDVKRPQTVDKTGSFVGKKQLISGHKQAHTDKKSKSRTRKRDMR